MNKRLSPCSRKPAFISERFYRRLGKAFKDFKGEGPWLTIIRCVTERHGGQIRLEGKPDNGSRFTLPWPLVLQEVPVKINSDPKASSRLVRTIRK